MAIPAGAQKNEGRLAVTPLEEELRPVAFDVGRRSRHTLKGSMSKKTVFISYAREDTRHAERLYMDLRQSGIDAWLDTKRILPGQDWRREARKVIREAAYFIALISQYSLNKRGFVQSEMKRALEVLSETPSNQIFIIPVRLDDSYPEDEQLRALNWVDLYPNYEKGLKRILTAISNVEKTPLEYHSAATPSNQRAPIHYVPYKTFSDFMQDFIEKLPKSSTFVDPDYAIYVKYHTTVLGVELPPRLLDKYPREIMIVLQHQFENLTALKDAFTVVLWFGGKPETLAIPYAAIQEIVIPNIGLRVEYFGRQ